MSLQSFRTCFNTVYPLLNSNYEPIPCDDLTMLALLNSDLLRVC